MRVQGFAALFGRRASECGGAGSSGRDAGAGACSCGQMARADIASLRHSVTADAKLTSHHSLHSPLKYSHTDFYRKRADELDRDYAREYGEDLSVPIFVSCMTLVLRIDY